MPQQPHKGCLITHRRFPSTCARTMHFKFTSRAVRTWLGRASTRPLPHPARQPVGGTATLKSASTASYGTSNQDREIFYTSRKPSSDRRLAPHLQPAPAPTAPSGTTHRHLKPPCPHPVACDPCTDPQPEERLTPRYQHNPRRKDRGRSNELRVHVGLRRRHSAKCVPDYARGVCGAGSCMDRGNLVSGCPCFSGTRGLGSDTDRPLLPSWQHPAQSSWAPFRGVGVGVSVVVVGLGFVLCHGVAGVGV